MFLFIYIVPCYCQKTTVKQETNIYKKYNSYKKEMYIDNILKEKIPEILYKNYYKNVMLNNYQEGLTQQWDTVNKIHRLYLYTQRAASGFLEVNKEVSGFTKVLPDSINVIYIQNQDTILKFDQVVNLISLKNEEIRNLKYRKDKNTFIVNIITD